MLLLDHTILVSKLLKCFMVQPAMPFRPGLKEVLADTSAPAFEPSIQAFQIDKAAQVGLQS